MAELNTGDGNSFSRKRHAKRKSTRIDFTPMVDLGFLLITFFMLTTSLKDMYVLDIVQPVEGPPTPVQDSIVMTVLLTSQDKVFYYFGFPESGILQTNFSPGGLRKILLESNGRQVRKVNELRRLFETKHISEKEYNERAGKVMTDRKSLMVFIKSDGHSRYKNLIDVLDELLIASVGRYSILDITNEELEFLEKSK